MPGAPSKWPAATKAASMVTILADNYYGYCKKEVKTQISFAANLYGLCEEEHSGGAIAFASYVARPGFLRRSHGPAEGGFFRGRYRACWEIERIASRKATR